MRNEPQVVDARVAFFFSSLMMMKDSKVLLPLVQLLYNSLQTWMTCPLHRSVWMPCLVTYPWLPTSRRLTSTHHPCLSKTFWLYTQINDHRFIILIDGGNTHNFLQTRVTKFLNLQLLPTSTLLVMVGNGSFYIAPIFAHKIPLIFRTKAFSTTSICSPLAKPTLFSEYSGLRISYLWPWIIDP